MSEFEVTQVPSYREDEQDWSAVGSETLPPSKAAAILLGEEFAPERVSVAEQIESYREEMEDEAGITQYDLSYLRKLWEKNANPSAGYTDNNKIMAGVYKVLGKVDTVICGQLEDVLSTSPSHRVAKVLRNICYLGSRGGNLMTLDQLSGYLMGMKEIIEEHKGEELARLKRNQEKQLEDFKQINQELKTVLQTYGEGASVFKLNLDKFAEITAKNLHAPSSQSAASGTNTPTRRGEVQWFFLYEGLKVICERGDYKANISATKYVNGDKLTEFIIKVLEYGNALRTDEQRKGLYRLKAGYLSMIINQSPRKWDESVKNIVTRYIEMYPNQVSDPPIMKSQMISTM